uniref:Uncharacterized protein n=1 Tax=Tanacetum cinerariifolium TaxID=118510 RepID=A0A6L2KPQ6_TANCI|nr:hypothetical protein [Tanacetum cinerariifolium]
MNVAQVKIVAFVHPGEIVVEDDYDVIHFDNSFDLTLFTSFDYLDFATLNIDGQSIDVDALLDIIDVDKEDDLINDEDVIPHDLADSEDEDPSNDDDDNDDMLADVARGYNGDGSDDDRPPPHQLPTSCRGKGTRNPTREAGKPADSIPAQFDMTPHMQFDLWPKISKEIEQHLSKIYIDNNSTLKKSIGLLTPTGRVTWKASDHDVPRTSPYQIGMRILPFGLIPRMLHEPLKIIKTGQRARSYAGRDPGSLAVLRDMQAQIESSDTREYPSLIQTYFDTYTVDGVFLRDEDQLLYEKLMRLQHADGCAIHGRRDHGHGSARQAFQSQNEVDSGSRSGGGRDDEPGKDEDVGEDEDANRDVDVDGDEDNLFVVNNSQKKVMNQMERPWRPEEDHTLLNLAEKHGLENWSLISESLPGRSGLSCSARWFSLQRSFTPEEDEMLQNLLEKHGPNWSLISESIPGRSAKSCELRWSSLLQFVRRPFTPEEDETILRLHALHGNKWATIARLLGTGRMDAVIKKRWNSTLKWKSISMTDEDITIGADQNRNLNLEVGGISDRKPPSISEMGRENMSSEGTHSNSRDRSAPSLNSINERDSSLVSDEDWKWMTNGRHNVQEFAGDGIFDRKNDVEGSDIDEPTPSWNALNERDSSVITDKKSDNVHEFAGDGICDKKNDVEGSEIDEPTPSWNALNERDSSVITDDKSDNVHEFAGDKIFALHWKWIMNDSYNVRKFTGDEFFDCKNDSKGSEIDEPAPSWNALNERDSSVITDDKSDNVQENS